VSDEVHIVAGGGIVLAAYRWPDSAHLHARCVTGAQVVGPIQVLESVPPEIRADVASDDDGWEDWNDLDTPVEDVVLEVSRESTSRASAKRPQ